MADGVPPDEHALAPNGVSITSEMLTHAIDYLAAVRQPSSQFEVDTTFESDKWRVNGRADHIAYDPVDNVLRVDDLKYGWRIVEPEGNWTLLFHAISHCIRHQLQPRSISLRIHQPRPYHPDGNIRSWNISYSELCAYFETLASALSDYDETLSTGPQCHNCPALATCSAARKAALNVVDLSEAIGSDDLDGSALARELDVLTRASKMISDRIDALENLARYKLLRGEIVDNYSLEQGLSNARWKNGINADFLLALTGQSMAQSKLVSPSEAKRRGMSADVVSALTERIPTKLNLVRVDADKRAKRLLKRK